MKQLHQNHSLLARRIRGMLNALYRIDKPNDEQARAIKSLEEQANQHERQAIFQNSFIMIL